MESITLGQILASITFIGAFIGGFKTIQNSVVKAVDKTLKPINDKIDNLELSSIKTDLVNFMALAEIGQVSQEQIENAYNLFDRYDQLGGNGFIHAKWEKLKKEGKI